MATVRCNNVAEPFSHVPSFSAAFEPMHFTGTTHTDQEHALVFPDRNYSSNAIMLYVYYVL